MLKTLSAALLVVAAPASAAEVTVETFAGNTIIADMPQTVAVYDMSALDTLEALGVQVDATIGKVYLDYLEDAAEGTERVGSLFEPDFEALNAVQPDLIIAGGRSQKVVPNLAEMAPTIDMTIGEDAIGQSLKRLDAYGKIFGKEREAAAVRAAFEEKLALVKRAAPNQGKALIVLTNGPKISAYGAEGRFGWLHTAFGLEEAVADIKTAPHGEAVSFEFIRNADPDLMLVIDRGAAIGQEASARATLDNALVHETKAWQSGKVVFLDSAPIYIAGGGVQSLNGTMDQLLAAFTGN